MKDTGRAFEFEDLAVLLDLDLTDPADLPDIEAIEEILARRRDSISNADHGCRNRATLRLVPDISS